MKELVIDAKPENLDGVLEFLNAELAAVGCSAELQMQIGIAAEEIFVNIAHYAYNPVVGYAVIRVCVGDEIIIEFEDNGVPYNPLAKRDPDLSLSTEERDIGGLGIYLVKDMMDRVEYRNAGHKNILTIRKSLA